LDLVTLKTVAKPDISFLIGQLRLFIITI
jgi:hypothetical protein